MGDFYKTGLSLLPVISLTVTPAPSYGGQKPLKEKENPQLIGKRDINKGQLNFYSLEKEVATGRRMAAEIDRHSKLLDDPAVIEIVNRITQNIVINSDIKIPVTVKVIDSSDINAFALPGGFLYVNRGLIEAADNEAELAGVIAIACLFILMSIIAAPVCAGDKEDKEKIDRLSARIEEVKTEMIMLDHRMQSLRDAINKAGGEQRGLIRQIIRNTSAIRRGQLTVSTNGKDAATQIAWIGERITAANEKLERLSEQFAALAEILKDIPKQPAFAQITPD